MAKISVRVGFSLYDEEDPSIVGVAFRAWDTLNGKRDLIYGDRFAVQHEYSSQRRGEEYSVQKAVETVVEEFKDEFDGPMVLEVELQQSGLAEKLESSELHWNVLQSVYSINFKDVGDLAKGLNSHALRANRNLRGRDVAHSKELL